LAWHRQKVSRIVSFNEGQTDQDFAGPSNDTYAILDDAINEAQRAERNHAVIECGDEWFKVTENFSWPANQVTFAFPTYIDQDSIAELYDVTNDSRGLPIIPFPRAMQTKIFWLDKGTLQFEQTGPGSDITLQVVYIAQPHDLKDPLDEPDLFPYAHRDLLNWSAACILRDMADEQPPARWIERRDEYRENFHLMLAKGKPRAAPFRIRNQRQRRIT
jgi:hypothetical protein